MGLPTNFPVKSLPNIIVLDKGNLSVSYNLYCKEFQVNNLFFDGYSQEVSWENLNQNAETTPWTFRLTVDLDLYNNDSAFSHLPTEVQNQVKNLCPGSMFSVQQLYLNLNNVGIVSEPTIHELSSGSPAYNNLRDGFLNPYLKKIIKDSKSDTNPNGNYLLGYSVIPSKPGKSSSIKPTNLNFMISPYLDANGNATKEYDLYTLNWLIMTEDHKMPAPVQFEWNWVDKSNISEYHGVMSIKKATFTNFLNKLLSPSLKSACIIPHCYVGKTSRVEHFKFKYDLETSEQSYQLVNDETSKVLTFSYSKESNASYGKILIDKMYHKYTLQTDVYLEASKIKIVATSALWFDMIVAEVVKVEGVNVENIVGNFAKKQFTIEYGLSVDAYGNLKVTEGEPMIVDQSDPIDTNWLIKIGTFGLIDPLITSVKISISKRMNNFMTGYKKEILSMLTGSQMWVFPGGQTFAFKNAQFSNHQDLVADITYTEPTQK
jgi:hypothetical protein